MIREIKRDGESGVLVTWSDASQNRYPSRLLRENCPCASCKESRGDGSHAAPLTPKKSALQIVQSSSEEELKLCRIWPVGNYAVGLEWGDGHNTGIYTLNYLQELKSQAQTASN